MVSAIYFLFYYSCHDHHHTFDLPFRTQGNDRVYAGTRRRRG